MINVLIVDDEPLAIEVIENYVSQIPQLHLVKTCTNAIEANEALKEHVIDLMFLDIHMPQMTGLEFLKTLTNPPHVIITTAHPNYALEGFELNVIDYLMKPISLDRFLKAVNKVTDKITPRKTDIDNSAHESSDEFFFVKADKKLVKINFNEILYIEGLKDYVIIRQEGGRVITLQTMKSLEDRLPGHMFKRVHRSYIVNINKIQAILGNMVEVTEAGKIKQLPIGKNYRDELLELINDNKL